MSEISDTLRKIIGNNKDMYFVGTIKSVDGVLCDVTPEDGTADLLGIRLCAEDSDTKFVIIPTVGSKVYVTMDSETGGIVTGFSEVEEVYLRGDSEGGLVKVNDLVTKLNNIENDLNTLKSLFTSWVVVPSDGGAALKAITATWAGQTLTVTNVNDLENEKVKHG